jgi:hypothetical protein
MDSRHKAKIREWMLATISDGGIDRLDHLHVDAIDENWKQRTSWISASIRAYELAVSMQSNLGLSVKVSLVFSLLDGTGQTFDTEEEFESQLDWAPPSLYLLKAGDQRHLSNVVRVDPLPKAIACRFPQGTKSFLSQWAMEYDSVRRTVFIEA